MSDFEIHECKYQGNGVRVERCSEYFQGKDTWRLVISRSATEHDLENNRYLEEIGQELWCTLVEINHCPFCGTSLREEKIVDVEFVHCDSRGWRADIC
jgi:hypothetical protein